MARINNPLDEVRIPFAKMSFTPDVPSTALGPNEYNVGSNIETDTRGIRSVFGDEEIFDTIPGTPFYITAGFRQGGEYWFIVATEEGSWYASTDGTWQDITPGGTPITGYTQTTNITEAWNGNVPVFNDTIGNPMFLPDLPNATLSVYGDAQSFAINSVDISTPVVGQVTINIPTQATAPYSANDYINVNGATTEAFNGSWRVVSSTVSTVVIYCDLTTITLSPGANIASNYVWNYNPAIWKKITAGFLRMYNTPNVGSILVAGNLTFTYLDDTTENFPVTVQWSQAFGLNQMPLTWKPNLLQNVADQLEVPLRGPAQDAFPANGQLYICSYWDTVVLSPINYTTTAAPILGVRLFNQGRGLLNPNCSVNTDRMVYGVDARDIWMFDGNDFQGLGNQRVKNWFFDQIDPAYTDRIHMEVNTNKNQIEIYYPTTDAVNGVPNKMISYRYDLDAWNPPRDVSSASFSCESPVWNYATTWNLDLSSRTVVYVQGIENSKLVMKDQGYTFLDGPIESLFRRDNIKMLKDYSGKLMVHRILPEVVNIDSRGVEIIPSTGKIEITIEGANSIASLPAVKTPVEVTLDTDNPWAQINQNAYRVNTIEIGNTSSTDAWICPAVTWQFTQTEDDR
jgi:hypothetical protein